MSAAPPAFPERRRLLAALAAAGAALLAPARRLFAAPRPVTAFREEDFERALAVLLDGREARPGGEAVRIGVAELAENGAVVPLKVESDLPGVEAVTLLATKNPVPLIARFEFAAGVEAFVATRVKLAESSDVVALVETADGVFVARRHVRVTIGGCGG